MDKLRKQRGPVRTAVTLTVNEVEQELTKDVPDQLILGQKNIKLEEKLEQLNDLDTKIQDAMLETNCTEEELNAESKICDDYRDKVQTTFLLIKSKLLPPPAPSSPADSVRSSARSENGQQRSFKLPKIELKKFSGELKEWLGFWAQFKKIHEDDSLHPSDKFQYLIQAMEPQTEAWELVNGYPASADNYPLAVEALKERFGRESLLLQVYVRELLRLVVGNVTQKDKMPLEGMYLKLDSHLRALNSLNVATADPSTWLFPLVESSLPEEILRTWQRSSLSKRDGKAENPPKTTLDFLMEFLKSEVQSEQRISLAQAGFQSVKQKPFKKNFRWKAEDSKHQEEQITVAGLHVGEKISCIFCEKTHESDKCIGTLSMTLDEKIEAVKTKKVCFICFKKGHWSKSCKSFVKCVNCGKRHHVIMCPELPKHQKRGGGQGKSVGDEDPLCTSVQKLNATFAGSSAVLLGTFRATLVSGNKKLEVRALYDPGAQRSYMSSEVAEKLNLVPIGEQKISHSLFGGIQTDVQTLKSYNVSIINRIRKGTTQMNVLEKQKICGDVPRLPPGPWLKVLKKNKIWVSDMVNDGNYEVDLLVGADIYGKLLTGRTQQVDSGLTAIETLFGWVVMGSVNSPGRKEGSMAMSVINMHISDEMSLENLWNLETIGIQDPGQHKSKLEREVATKEHFLQTVSREADGRYSVCLPWIDGAQKIPDNRKIAEARLNSATTKLRGAVFKPSSKTTPVRPVFDASCKSGRNPSLNDCLEKGPNQLERIPYILLRFRERRIGVLSDIRKAFLMICVDEKDREFLRFLWWESPESENIKTFRHCRVVFGVNCSPFLLAAVLEFHLNAVQDEKKFVAQKLLQSLYVDNCVTSVDSYEKYDEFRTISTGLLADAKMDLRQWEFTALEETGIGSLTSRECGLGSACSDSSQELTNVLGYQWNKREDTLKCHLSDKLNDIPEKLTKRVILSRVQQVFDPLGILCPVMLPPKIVLQQAWEINRTEDSKMKRGRKSKEEIWDTELPTQLVKQFRDWYGKSSTLANISFPRWIRRNFEREELHLFGDATKDVYAAAAFLRVENDDGVSVQLLQAKSRVAPLKKMSIPRLELMACTISARLMKSCCESLDLKNIRTYIWSDSTTALAWIRRNDEWGTFVGNRVKEILRLTDVTSWRHIPGILNPADLPSRGCTAAELALSTWWEGPDWLRRPREEWPTADETVNEDDVLQEKKKSALILNTIVSTPWYVRQYPFYLSNLRVFAFILRFVRRMQKKSVEKGQLTTIEVEKAEQHMIRLVQQEIFPREKVTVIAGVKVERTDEGTLCVKTKLQNRIDAPAFKHPVLLPSDHPMVEQLIRETHLMNRHAGVQILLCRLREKYWILQGRRVVKKIISRCVPCRRFMTKAVVVPDAPLPEDRIKEARTFQITGVDLAGPLFLHKGTKAWIVLFTCAIYRAVHLEMVRSLSTDSFILALHRFSSRRGRPEKIYSDNGTNFVGANNLFAGLDWKRIERETKTQRIQWKFNPPAGPWWGGFYERMIRTIKDLLRKSLGHSKLNEVQLETCLCEVEAIINSRPLTYITEDAEDLVPLTPAMFLQDIQTCDFPEEECLQADGLVKRYRSLAKLKEELRSRFRLEYLALLVHRGKSRKPEVFHVGDVVLVGSDNKKRHEWPLAIIEELLPGSDGNVRVAKVRTATSQFTRPLQRLFPLEVTEPQKLQDGETVEEESVQAVQESDAPENVTHRTRFGREVKVPDRLKF